MKRLDELAVFGGTPTFPTPRLVGRPNIADRDRFLARVGEAFDRQWLTNGGPLVEEFEQRLAERLQVRHCLAVVNGTVGLELVARATGLTGEVIVPAFTFLATPNALAWVGLTPIFCDVDPDSHNIDPSAIEALITPRTTAILAVHLWGRAAPVEALGALADRHGLVLLFDASHAIGCTHRGRPLGGFGRAEVLSFHATKLLNTFEGGAIATNDDTLAETLGAMRNFGYAPSGTVGHLGINAKMNEACAAMGLVNLDGLDRFMAANLAAYEAYRDALTSVPGVTVMAPDPAEQASHQYIVAEIHGGGALSRDQVQAILLAEGIGARRYFHPGCHRLEPYRTTHAARVDALPVTDRLAERTLVLPTGASVSPAEATTVAELIRLVVTDGATVAERLRHVTLAPVGR